MNDLTAKNILIYLGTFILPPIVDAVYQAIAAQMVGGKPVDWGQVGIVALMAGLAAYIASTRPRVGHEAIAAQVDLLKSQGVPKAEQVVVTQDEAVHGIAPSPDREPLTAEQLEQVYQDMRKRMGAPS